MPSRRTPHGPTAAALAGELRATLGVLYRRIRQTKALEDLTLPESSALSRLRTTGPASGAALAKLERISPQSMAATLAKLVDKGLVERAPDPDDGRRILVALTAAGRDVVESRRSARTAQLAAALATLSASERATLHAALPLLERIAHELE
jgi:DNA-binding MarR family transcriptional regulator